MTAPVDAVWRDAPAQGLQVLIALPEGHDVFSLSILLDLLAAVEPDRRLLPIGVWRKGGMVGVWGSGCLALAQARLLTGRRFVLPAESRARSSARWPRLCPVNQSFCDDHRVLALVGKSIISDMALHLASYIVADG